MGWGGGRERGNFGIALDDKLDSIKHPSDKIKRVRERIQSFTFLLVGIWGCFVRFFKRERERG